MLLRVRRDLAAVNEAIRYARGVLPVMPAPELGGAVFARFELGLHHVPADVFYAALAVNDDLPWDGVRRYRDEECGYQYFTVALELPHARLVLFSEHDRSARRAIMADSLTPPTGAVVAEDGRILLRVARGGIHIAERELRHQLARKDNHPLAQEDERLDVLVQMKERGLIEAEMCLRLAPRGRAVLAGTGASERATS